MSAFLGPDQTATEALLATDPDVLPWVQKYQRSRETVSETDYQVNVSVPSQITKNIIMGIIILGFLILRNQLQQMRFKLVKKTAHLLEKLR